MALPHSGIPAADPAPQDATVDDLTAATLTVTGASTLAAVTATSIAAPHSGLTEVTADQHHAQLHGHTGADGSGTVAHSATTGQTANDHHAQSHGHTGADGSGTVAHSATTGLTANDHHNQAHVITGADHTASGLTAGHVLRATGATAFSFGAIADGDIPATIARDTEVTSAVSTHEAAADPHAGYLLESAHNAALRFVPIDRATVFNGATTAAAVARTLTAAITELPSHAVRAVGYIDVSADVAGNNGNFLALFQTQAGTSDFASIARSVAGAALTTTVPFEAGVIQSSGSKLSYQIGRAAGTITYSLFVTGYWTAQAA